MAEGLEAELTWWALGVAGMCGVAIECGGLASEAFVRIGATAGEARGVAS